MNKNIRNLLLGVVVVIVLAVLILRGDQLQELIATMKTGLTLPLVVGIITQLCKYFSQGFAYSFCFDAVGEHMDVRNTVPLVFGTFFMNTVAPSMNLAGMTLVVDDARRRGIDPGRASSAALLMQITIDGAFTLIMIVGFAFVVLVCGMNPLWFLPGIAVILLVAGMIAIMVLANKNRALLMRILHPIERLVNKVLAKFKKGPLEPWAEEWATRFGAAAAQIVRNPRPALKAYGCSLIASLCELTCFCLVGVAFGVTSPGVLICGYIIATLFAMVSITPQGVGFVETALIVAFTAFGESAAAGTAIGLVYRGIVFWLPFIIGAILINTTKTFKGEKAVVQSEADEAVGHAESLDRAAATGSISSEHAPESAAERAAGHAPASAAERAAGHTPESAAERAAGHTLESAAGRVPDSAPESASRNTASYEPSQDMPKRPRVYDAPKKRRI